MTLKGHAKAVRPCAVSPQDKFYFSGDRGGIIKKWSVKTGEFLQEMTGEGGDLYGMCVSRDGVHLYTGGNDAVVRMWNMESGELVKTMDKDHGSWIEGLAETKDCKYIFTGSGDKTSKKYKVIQ